MSAKTADWSRYQDGRPGIHSPDSPLSVHSLVSWFLLPMFILSRRGVVPGSVNPEAALLGFKS